MVPGQKNIILRYTLIMFIMALLAIAIIAKAAIYFLLICIGFVFLQPIFEMISKAIMTVSSKRM